jgi:hypothetical protein
VIAAGTDACPFAIQVHSAGTIHTWTYADGTVKTILQNFHIEWTNLDTGKVATTPLGGPAIVYPDGTVVINGVADDPTTRGCYERLRVSPRRLAAR